MIKEFLWVALALAGFYSLGMIERNEKGFLDIHPAVAGALFLYVIMNIPRFLYWLDPKWRMKP